VTLTRDAYAGCTAGAGGDFSIYTSPVDGERSQADGECGATASGTTFLSPNHYSVFRASSSHTPPPGTRASTPWRTVHAHPRDKRATRGKVSPPIATFRRTAHP
jgi:hypothetical protein